MFSDPERGAVLDLVEGRGRGAVFGGLLAMSDQVRAAIAVTGPHALRGGVDRPDDEEPVHDDAGASQGLLIHPWRGKRLGS